MTVALAGCTGLAVMEFQDAEPLGRGNSIGVVGVSYGSDIPNLYRDSTWSLSNAISIPLPEARAGFALGGTTDLTAGAWSVSSLYLLPGFMVGHVETADLGLKAGVKQLLFGEDGPDKVAAGLSVFGYAAQWVLDRHLYAIDSNTVGGTYTGFGLAPALYYTRTFGAGAALYLGARVDIIRSHERFERNNRESTWVKDADDTRPFYAPFVGVRLGKKDHTYLEVLTLIGTNPGTGRVEAMPFFGIARAIAM
jgi:hypothetical protein